MGQSTKIAPKLQKLTAILAADYSARVRVARAIVSLSDLCEADQEAVTAAALDELRSDLRGSERSFPTWIGPGHGLP